MKEYANQITDGIIRLMESIEPEESVNITPEKRQKLITVVEDSLHILDLIIPPLVFKVVKEIRSSDGHRKA